MSIIGVTGVIAGGKSTGLEMLQRRTNFGPQFGNISFINLDQYSKQLTEANEQVKSARRHFFYKHFPGRWMEINNAFIIENIFTQPALYEEFCSIYVPHIEKVLKNCQQTLVQEDGVPHTFIIEASSIYAYPELYQYFDYMITIDPSEHTERNARVRGVNPKHFKIIKGLYLEQRPRMAIDPTINHKLSSITLNNGTLMELRGKIETAIIIALSNINLDDEYFELAGLMINRLRIKFTESDWNNNPYHNKDHTRTVLTDLILRGHLTETLGNVAIWHDIDHTPMHNYNEVKAVNRMNESQKSGGFSKIRDIWKVSDIIRGTKYDQVITDTDLAIFALSDMSHFTRSPEEIIETETLLFKEYSVYDWRLYQTTHIKVLNNISLLHESFDELYEGIQLAISFLKTFEPKIAWFCGSFGPFTVGHLDVLRKAEKMFDKVVIVKAQNPNKSPNSNHWHKHGGILDNYQVILAETNIPDLLKVTNYTPILVRGIRNQQDVDDANTWIAQINELTQQDIECCLILGRREFSHISSTFVRSLIDSNINADRFLV